ncbi:peptidylprolyl isomerase [Pseudonocardia charpentierae]|uniref:Peptidylprolyl isomerase n=1 Tax=Pseudonocardia charpentierae TaxID=3075545 RepID=A0ABU2N838_9PSEU|nr:peptidylprolyl isomerase [Pseudonocardia sp. DSM 45834]MDT0349454.1 peptidylprolyl isomerase [Pseudonocardia sp. DSM 45834]
MYRQVGRALAVVATVGVVVSGCGAGPSQVGSAVIVGTTAVPLEQVQSRLDVALGKTDVVAQLASSGVGAPDIARDVVTGAVMHDLLARTAATEGITVSEADVDAALQESGGADAALSQSLYDLSAIRERVRDRLIAVKHAQRIVPGLTITADLVAANSRDDAAAKARVLATGGPEADALFASNPETSRRNMSYQAVRSPEAASTVLFGLPVGRTAYFQPSPQQGGWIVLRVTDRQEDANADPSAAASLGDSDLAAIGDRLLQPLSEEVGVRVNPRFGVWDPVSMRVVAADQQGGAILPLMG